MATTPDGMFGIVRDLSRKLTYTIDLAHSLTEERIFENIGGWDVSQRFI